MKLCLIAWKRGPASLPAKVEFFLPWYCKKVWGGIFSTDSVTLSSTSSICSLQNNIKLGVTILLYFCIYQDTFKDNNWAWLAQTHSKTGHSDYKQPNLVLAKEMTLIFFSHLRVKNPCEWGTSNIFCQVIQVLPRSTAWNYRQGFNYISKLSFYFFFSFWYQWQVLAMLHYN